MAWRRAGAELVGTALLAAVVVGSTDKAVALGRDPATVLLATSLATSSALGVLILLFAPVSGGHLNPVVTLTVRGLSVRARVVRLVAQLLGAAVGAVLAEAMFGRPLLAATGARLGGAGTLLGEVVGTAGLILVVQGLDRTGRDRMIPSAVAAYVAAGIWSTSSGAFANPAVTVARSLTGGPSGLAPASLPAFLAAQLMGAALGGVVAALIFRRSPEASPEISPEGSADASADASPDSSLHIAADACASCGRWSGNPLRPSPSCRAEGCAQGCA
ncbi:aquaporin [Streptacidiphilus sp. MAP5-3]|uniref:aquaporin n=1 Tax=unclassified Streptacidiphilus TaxID=2643834 RepID=UPI003512558F